MTPFTFAFATAVLVATLGCTAGQQSRVLVDIPACDTVSRARYGYFPQRPAIKSVQGAAAIVGTIRDGATGVALVGVSVRLAPVGRMTETDSLGGFFFEGLVNGQYVVSTAARRYAFWQRAVEVTTTVDTLSIALRYYHCP